MSDEKRIFSFEPVADANSRVLVLGTIASPMSLETGFFYGHPRNGFWEIIARFFSFPLPIAVEEKRRMLLENRLALWDTLKSCQREGALDADIKNPEINDVKGLLQQHPHIRAVLLNGGTAYKLYQKSFGAQISLPSHKMPSTSPAFAAMKPEDKFNAWAGVLGLYY